MRAAPFFVFIIDVRTQVVKRLAFSFYLHHFAKLFIGTLDVVAAADEVAGAFAVVDAGSGIVVSLGHAAFFHHRVRQRDSRQQAPGVGMNGICKKFLPSYPFPAGGPDGAHRYGRRCT